MFAKRSTVEGLTPTGILSTSDDNKREIQQLVDEGLKSGLITPFPYEVFPSTMSSIDAADFMR